MRDILRQFWAKPLLFVLLLSPMGYLVWGLLTDALGPNPAETIIRFSGETALRYLCLTLAVTPLRVISGWSELARFRRMIGVFSFFYALLHLLSYSWLDMGFEVAEILTDIAKRPFILVGMLTFSMLLALAATSMNAAIRRLGAQRWKMLHRLVYPASLLALLHFFWMREGKNDFVEVGVYALIVIALLAWRMRRRMHPSFRV